MNVPSKRIVTREYIEEIGEWDRFCNDFSSAGACREVPVFRMPLDSEAVRIAQRRRACFGLGVAILEARKGDSFVYQP
jgi:hypothetical protein